jgi:hypothetical protein
MISSLFNESEDPIGKSAKIQDNVGARTTALKELKALEGLEGLEKFDI